MLWQGSTNCYAKKRTNHSLWWKRVAGCVCALCVNMISSRMVGRMCVCVYVAVLLKQYQRIWNRLSFGSLQFINFDWGSFFRRISLFAMNRYLFEMCVFVHMLICDRIIDFFSSQFIWETVFLSAYLWIIFITTTTHKYGCLLRVMCHYFVHFLKKKFHLFHHAKIIQSKHAYKHEENKNDEQ